VLAHQAVEADRQRWPLDRCGGADGEGMRMRVVRSIMGMILVLSVIVVARRWAVLRAEPTLHFGQSSRGVSRPPASSEAKSKSTACASTSSARPFSDFRRLTSRATSALPAVALGDDQPVGHHRLANGLSVTIELRPSMYRIDRRHRAGVAQPRMIHYKIGDRHRISQAVVSITMWSKARGSSSTKSTSPCPKSERSVQQGIHPSHGCRAADRTSQQMIEPDLANLVDENGGGPRLRLDKPALKECCPAAAQEAGDHGHGDRRGDGAFHANRLR
jgi:hypothetical protein